MGVDQTGGYFLRGIAALVIVLLLSASTPAEERPDYDRYLQPGQMVDVGGRRLNLRCEGNSDSGITIPLESGLAFQSIGCIAPPPPGASAALRNLLRQQRMSQAGFEAAHAETMAFETANDAILAARTKTLGSIPLVILSARGNYAEPNLASHRAALLEAQFAMHQSLAALSTRGEVRWADAEHVVQTSNPALVVRVVDEMLQSLKSRR